MNVKCNEIEIKSKCTVSYLGADLDQDLSGKTMGYKILKKVNNGLKFLYRNSKFLRFRERKMLCSSLLTSHYDYGYNTYYRTLETYCKERLQCSQNKMIRFILNEEYRYHLNVNDFCKVNYLPVEYRIKYLTLNLMFKIHVAEAPQYLLENFSKIQHSHNTRYNNDSYVIPNVKGVGTKTFVYNGTKLWNNLPINLKKCDCKDVFNSKCKKYLFEIMSKEENCDFMYY